MDAMVAVVGGRVKPISREEEHLLRLFVENLVYLFGLPCEVGVHRRLAPGPYT